MTKETKKKFWYFLDHLAGDKIVWIILLMLMLLSILFIFSLAFRVMVSFILLSFNKRFIFSAIPLASPLGNKKP